MFSTIFYSRYTIIPSLIKRFEMMVIATLRKNLDLQCQNRTMTHVFRKTKSHTQHALFCDLLNCC